MHQLAADFASPDAGSSALIVEGVDVAAVEPALAGGALEEVVGGTGARILVIALALPAAVEGLTHPPIAVKPVPVVFAVAVVSLGTRGLLVANTVVLTGPPIARVAAERRRTNATTSARLRTEGIAGANFTSATSVGKG